MGIKKIISLLLAVTIAAIMALSLTSCGKVSEKDYVGYWMNIERNENGWNFYNVIRFDEDGTLEVFYSAQVYSDYSYVMDRIPDACDNYTEDINLEDYYFASDIDNVIHFIHTDHTKWTEADMKFLTKHSYSDKFGWTFEDGQVKVDVGGTGGVIVYSINDEGVLCADKTVRYGDSTVGGSSKYYKGN